MNFFKQWFTEKDNSTFCVVRALLTSGGVAMVYKFVVLTGTVDFQAFGLGLAGIGAAIAAKNASEKQP